jgi:hypothetical protein
LRESKNTLFSGFYRHKKGIILKEVHYIFVDKAEENTIFAELETRINS